jgi:plastocyanin
VAIVAQLRSGAVGKSVPAATKAVMDQINKEFVPETLIVRTGTQVFFPNSDSIAHQVYSFSPTKRFELPLYRGRPYPPVVFDQPGIATLGCNIHDRMVGYIVVTDSPYFGLSDEAGTVVLRDVPPGSYTITAWHPRARESLDDQSVTLEGPNQELLIRMNKTLRPKRSGNTDRNIRDY